MDRKSNCLKSQSCLLCKPCTILRRTSPLKHPSHWDPSPAFGSWQPPYKRRSTVIDDLFAAVGKYTHPHLSPIHESHLASSCTSGPSPIIIHFPRKEAPPTIFPSSGCRLAELAPQLGRWLPAADWPEPSRHPSNRPPQSDPGAYRSFTTGCPRGPGDVPAKMALRTKYAAPPPAG